MSATVSVRRYRADDREFVLSLARRFADFDIPTWRTPGEIAEGTTRALEHALAAVSPEIAVFVAEAPSEGRLGFVHLVVRRDFFTGEPIGHISEIAVAEEAQGRRVGRALLEAGEAWARERGYSALALNVFVANQRARRLYERLGYAPETMSYVKRLATDPD